MSKILIKPIITEKMTEQSEKNNRYGFVVDREANKLEIKNAVEEMYGVTVDSINTMNYIGKIKARNTRAGQVFGRLGRAKKAIVTLKDGETIDFYTSI